MQTWIEIDKYGDLNGLSIEVINQKIEDNSLNSRVEGDMVFIEVFDEEVVPDSENIEVLKSENTLLKDSLYMLQELAQEDQDTIKTLTQQLDAAQRKYKLIWDKTIEDFAQNENKAREQE